MRSRRAREALRKALARGREEEAVDCLLELPAEERTAHLGAVAALVREDIARAHRAGQWSRLHRWAVRAEHEPALLSHGLAANAAAELRWAVLWGAIRSADFMRARRLLCALEAELGAHGLLPALRALVEASGAPDSDALSGLLPAEVKKTTDPRLGYDDPVPRPQPPPPMPTSIPIAAGAVLTCFACQPWPRFRDVVLGWLQGGPPEVTCAIAASAAELACLHALDAASLEERRIDAASFAALAIARAEAPPSLEQAASLALRAVAHALPSGPVESKADARALLAVSRTAGRYERLQPLLDTLIQTTLFARSARAVGLEILAELCTRRPNAALFWKALRLSFLDPRVQTPPSWLEPVLDRLLDRPDELVHALAAGQAPQTDTDLELLMGAVTLDRAEVVLDRLWSAADEKLRPALARAFGELLDRARHRTPVGTRGARDSELEEIRELLRTMTGSDAELAVDEIPDDVLRAMLSSPMGRQLRRELDLDSGPAKLAERPLKMLERWLERVLCHDERFLELALQQTAEPSERRQLVARVLQARPSMEDRLAWLQSADMNHHELARDALGQHLVDGFEHDLDALARALLTALDMGAPAWVLRRIARPLVDGAYKLEGAPSDLLARGLHAARPYARPRRKRGAGKQRAGRKRKRSAHGNVQPLFDRLLGGGSR